jgi:hypothetical protein
MRRTKNSFRTPQFDKIPRLRLNAINWCPPRTLFWGGYLVFARVPLKLEQFVRNIRSDPNNPDFKYVQAALYVALNYIQIDLKDIATRRFLRAPDDPNAALDYEFSCRVLEIGEILFNLRNVVGFSEICRRLKRDLRSGFFETFAARLFFDEGLRYLLHRRPRKKGKTSISMPCATARSLMSR